MASTFVSTPPDHLVFYPLPTPVETIAEVASRTTASIEQPTRSLLSPSSEDTSSARRRSPRASAPRRAGGKSARKFRAKAQTELNFPTGVAYSMPASQMVRVELHFVNTTTKPWRSPAPCTSARRKREPSPSTPT